MNLHNELIAVMEEGDDSEDVNWGSKKGRASLARQQGF